MRLPVLRVSGPIQDMPDLLRQYTVSTGSTRLHLLLYAWLDR